jgi:hypothetical protein
MSSAFATLSLTMAMHAFGLGGPGLLWRHDPTPGMLYILPDGPGDGWGFPNGQPDHYGWADHGVFLPLGANRTPEYFFPRYFAAPAMQMFPQTYYNCFETRGQRYIPFAGGGGEHPMGGPPISSSHLPVSPYTALPEGVPQVQLPRLNGVMEAQPSSSGGSGLTP